MLNYRWSHNLPTYQRTVTPNWFWNHIVSRFSLQCSWITGACYNTCQKILQVNKISSHQFSSRNYFDWYSTYSCKILNCFTQLNCFTHTTKMKNIDSKTFFSCQKFQSGQTVPLFCISELIRNPFWLNRVFMLPLLHTPTPQPWLKFCSKEAKTSYFHHYERLIPKHGLLRYSFTNTVTEHQKSVHGCFPFLEPNLDLWDRNWGFTNGFFKWLVPRAIKEFT